MFEVYYHSIKSESAIDVQAIPFEYRQIIKFINGIDLECQFGLTHLAKDIPKIYRIGIRAYQKARNKFQAEEAEEIRRKNNGA